MCKIKSKQVVIWLFDFCIPISACNQIKQRQLSANEKENNFFNCLVNQQLFINSTASNSLFYWYTM